MKPSSPRSRRRRALPARTLAPLAATLLLAACAAEDASRQPGGTAASAGGGEEVLAVLDGAPLTVASLDGEVIDQLAALEFQYLGQRQQLLESGLEKVIRERLLAAEAGDRGVSVEELVAEEVGPIEVTSAQVLAFYESNAGRLQGRSLEELRPAIQQYLTDQRQEEALAALTEELAEARGLERRLEPLRVDLEVAGHPTLGEVDARVTLVEFSDFECPYCGGFFQTLEQIRGEYGDRIRIVYRQFPLREIHPNAQKAAEASLCAAEQGHFWEMHDMMFREQHSLAVADLKDKAQRIGLDAEAFASCLDSGRHQERVEADLTAGQRVGVRGTPALFVNGRPVDGGAVPFETIAEIIDEELARGER